MSTLTETRHTGEFIQSEANGSLSRDVVTLDVPAATTYEPGTVLAAISSTGHYGPYNSDKSDGLENAIAILYDTVTNPSASVAAHIEATVINKDAEVKADALIWADGVDETAGALDLRAVGIKIR